MKKIIPFLRNWTLPVSMISGALGYLLYARLNLPAAVHTGIAGIISVLQPSLIFTMLFLSFCKVDPHDLKLSPWHGWLVLIQTGFFLLLGGVLMIFPAMGERVIVESAMICMICPTATAAIVVTDKLGGNPASLTSYTIMGNMITALMVPLLLPLVHPVEGMTFLPSFWIILKKVFPLLILPFFAAWFVRKFLPPLHRKLIGMKDLAFYLWAVALAIAIAVTVREIIHSRVAFIYAAGIGGISLLACLLQFGLGWKAGEKYGERVTAGQALGQKNTVFAIWMGYTFLTPVTSLAGGFYSIWHNTMNSYQLYQRRKNRPLP